jgi:hypothetical protein
VKADYDLLKASRLVEQDIHLEKMLAQEMARALHLQYRRGQGEGEDEEEQQQEEEEGPVAYPSLEAANRELDSLEAQYLNEEVERDLRAMEGVKMEVSLQEQELLSLEQRLYEASQQSSSMKADNNAVMVRIKALKGRESDLRARQQSLLELREAQEQEMNRTKADLGFYLRSRDTLANLPAAEVSQGEVRTGSVRIVESDSGGGGGGGVSRRR